MLSRRDWVYLLSLLAPLAAYSLLLKAAGILLSLKAAGNVSQGGADGVFDALKLMRSDLLFNLGYAVLWVGLFAAARGGFFRRIVVFLFHATAVLVVATTTFAYQYFEATGSTLDYSVVYYLAKLGEIDGLIAREAVWYVWVFLAAALLYVVLGPWVLARNADTRSEDRPNPRQLGFSRLTSSGICLAAAALVALSLVPGAADANRSFSLSPPVNVLATGVGGARSRGAYERVVEPVHREPAERGQAQKDTEDREP